MVTTRTNHCIAVAAASLAASLALAEPPSTTSAASPNVAGTTSPPKQRPDSQAPLPGPAIDREFRVETLVRPLPACGPLASGAPVSHETSFPNALQDLPFRDREPLINRLRALRALPIVTLWDSRQATVYVGVNRDGEPGLHLRQKRDRDAGPPLGARGTDSSAPDSQSAAPPTATAKN